MRLDFTFTKYRELCEAMVSSDYAILTVKEYLTMGKKPDKYIIPVSYTHLTLPTNREV